MIHYRGFFNISVNGVVVIDRLNGSMNLSKATAAITSYHVGATAALDKTASVLGDDAFGSLLFELDTRRLYDYRIYELFQLCGEDPKRFVYHVFVELPNQDTGEWGMCGPYAAKCRKHPGFKDARRFGKPGSFWALENPPSSRDYMYPIL